MKPLEGRVAMTPEGACRLRNLGAVVLLEAGAGVGAGFRDRHFRESGAQIVRSKRELYRRSDLVLKVKEPQPAEYPFLRPGLILFAFLHLAAEPRLLRVLLKKRVTAIAFETVEDEAGRLPILRPMSEIAGKLASLIGANYLRKDLGGKGKLLASVGEGGRPGRVTVIGLGQVGAHAARIAHGLGASLFLYDRCREKGERLSLELGKRCRVVEDPKGLPEVIRETDLIIGAVYVTGRRAPRIVTQEMVRQMEPGSVIVDVAVDQGGCVETIRPTTLKDPIFLRYGVLHCGVTNLPSLVPRTATEALVSKVLPYVSKIMGQGLEKALASDAALRKGLNLRDGEIVHPALFHS